MGHKSHAELFNCPNNTSWFGPKLTMLGYTDRSSATIAVVH